METPTANSDTHRDRLLAAARQLLRDRDYGTITARDLVAASNTNLGSIGYHFGSKEQLLNTAIGLALEEWADSTMVTAAADSRNAGAALINSVRHILDNYDAVRPFYQAFVAALARCTHSAALQTQLADHYNRQRDRVAASVSHALPPNVNPDIARGIASLIVAVVDGLMIQSHVARDDAPASSDIPACAAALAAAFEGNAIADGAPTQAPEPR